MECGHEESTLFLAVGNGDGDAVLPGEFPDMRVHVADIGACANQRVAGDIATVSSQTAQAAEQQRGETDTVAAAIRSEEPHV